MTTVKPNKLEFCKPGSCQGVSIIIYNIDRFFLYISRLEKIVFDRLILLAEKGRDFAQVSDFFFFL